MRIAVTIAVGAMLVGLVVAASIALSPGTQSTTAGISEAELIDLQAVADQKGMSLQAAIDRYAWNDDFAAAVAEIREAAPGAFTGAEITDAGNAWVAFAGSAPAAATSIIDNFTSNHSGVSVEVRTDKGFTEVELQKAIEAAHIVVFESHEVRDAATFFDFATGKVETVALLEDTAADTVLESLKVAAANKVTDVTRADILDTISSSVVRFQGAVLSVNEENTEHWGGEALSICTSGFGVESASGTRGISTAGHCPNNLTDDAATLTLESAHNGEQGDFQWHTGPLTFSNEFYAGNDSTSEVDNRGVTSVGSPSVGQTLCRNGKNSNRDCQQVRKINVCSSGACNLVQMGEHNSVEGDSGGPVYWGNTAYGLHKGAMQDPWPFWREVFSRADRIDNALGVHIATD